MDDHKHIELFMQMYQCSLASKVSYRRNLKQWFAWLESCGNKDEPDFKKVLLFKDHLLGRNLSPRTISNYLTSIKVYYRWLEQQGFAENICATLKTSVQNSTSSRFHKDALSLEQTIDFLEQIDLTKKDGIRDFALLNLMVRCGLRTVEVVRANVEDICQKDQKHILWVQGKGHASKDEFVVLTREAYQPIQNYLRTRSNLRSSEPLFTSLSPRNLNKRLTTRSIRRIAKNYLRLIDLDSPRISCHSLRHTAVTLALKAGAPIRQVQSMARHKSVTTTEIYAHDIDRLVHSAEEQVSKILPALKDKKRSIAS